LEAGLSQEKLAAEAGVHRNYVGDAERGELNVCLGNMCKLSRVLKITLTQLMRETEKHASI
jgi:transcriptional regulator with XRE-family HTH domain